MGRHGIREGDIMSLHITSFFGEEDGWQDGRCACGWAVGPCPDDETVVDALMEHAFEMGVQRGLWEART
jgi:hypothetical protein